LPDFAAVFRTWTAGADLLPALDCIRGRRMGLQQIMSYRKHIYLEKLRCHITPVKKLGFKLIGSML
jgi:hypothetical protein